MTNIQILRDIDRRIADMNQSLTMQIATLRSDLDMQRQETRYYRHDILSRLTNLEKLKGQMREGSFITLSRVLDMGILVRVLIALVLAGTGIMSVAEAVKVAVN